ncbi:MAG: flagellar basal-body MS-ring/collar protein FliF [Gammaproteobacteria bacterium]|nr:MAG: flagellar basal-body MS-ring/collar protein FliF [Gammaproteobacteria bacterium]
MALVNTESISAQSHGFGNLPIWRQLSFMVAMAASIALGISLFTWSQDPNYTMLYGNLTDKDVGQVMEALKKANIKYKIDRDTGVIMVSSDQVYNARITLAAESLPRGSNTGYEVLEQQEKFGISQFMETARYQQAMEGELARTITTIDSVQNARVHLAIPRQSAFVRNRRPPSASVVLNMYPGRNMTSGQVQAISHLVASGIPNLESNQVTVIDQKGRLLSSQDDDKGMASTRQLDYIGKLELSFIERIENILMPVVGASGIKAQVKADIDFTRVEQTQESYNPDAEVVRSEQIIEEQKGGAASASGIPGALSNQPPEAGTTAPVTAAAAGADTGSTQRRNIRTIRNYEVDKTISHTRLSTGMVKRLSIAVVVDNKRTVDEAGVPVSTPYTREELDNMTLLVKDAVGFVARRGDTINIINTEFNIPPVPEALPDTPIWEQPWVWSVARQVGGVGLVIFLLLAVMKPILRELASKGRELKEMAPAGQLEQFTAAGAEGSGNLALPQGGASSELLQAQARSGQITSAKDMAKQDPKLVAQVVRNWVGDEE